MSRALAIAALVSACASTRRFETMTVRIDDHGVITETRLAANGEVDSGQGPLARLETNRVVDPQGHEIARIEGDGQIVDIFGMSYRVLEDGSLMDGHIHMTIDDAGVVQGSSLPVAVRNFRRGREREVWLLVEAHYLQLTHERGGERK